MRPVNILLFDLGNVLFPFDWTHAIKGFSQVLKRPEEEIRGHFSDPDYAIMFYEFGTGRLSTERFCRQLNTHLSAALTLPQITRIWCSIFREDEKMTALFRSLGTKYRTYILSDTDILHWSFLHNHFGVEDWSSGGAILSFRQGLFKADAGAFAEILKRFQLDANAAVFIDDLEKNLVPARAAGLKTIRHTSYTETLQALKNLGVI